MEEEVNRFDLILDGLLYLRQRYPSFAKDIAVKQTSIHDIEIWMTDKDQTAIFHMSEISKVLNAVDGIQWHIRMKNNRPIIAVY